MTLKTVNIKGKNYVEVNVRIQEFRKTNPDFSLETEIIHYDDDVVCMKAVIKDENGRTIATGVARESQSDSRSIVNSTSHWENCETSAWGRALANFGIGIDESIASAQEVHNAIKQQEAQPETLEDFEKAIKGAKIEKYLGKLYYGWSKKFEKTSQEYKYLNDLSSARKQQILDSNLIIGLPNKEDYIK